MSTAPSPVPTEPKVAESDEGKLVRQLVIAVILSILSTLGVGGVAISKGDLSPEVRSLLSSIQTSLTRLEGKMESQDRDQLRLENRVDKLEAVTQELQRKAPR